MKLRAEHFADFFMAVHGVRPFPWQERLARHVFERGWPTAIDVPTGGGKTAAIDVAVFHLALDPPPELRAVRIAFVVDRRIVVDEAFLRAEKIARAVKNAKDKVVAAVAEQLSRLAEDERDPLVAVRLRGGMPKDPDWIRTPSQPAVITSTVDQVGSRLFFRGYGVSDSMRPVHAGLLGSDTLFLLDEAHLSQPFVQSLRDARKFFGLNSTVVTLSATQTDTAPALLTSDDRRHEVLGARLKANKPVDLIVSASEHRITECVERAWSFSREAQHVAIIVNRVARARDVHGALVKKAGADAVALMIGRARPLERDAHAERLRKELPQFVVATQCIEAGADLDFDAMVTELAPLDCLRQRFGRLNRTGRAIAARGAIIAVKDEIAKNAKPDRVYESSLRPTWELLADKAKKNSIDFGIDAAAAWMPEDFGACIAPREDAPVMLPAFIEQWVCTSPRPAADPEVSLFLHGPRSGPPEVQIVWRADLAPDDPFPTWRDRVTACPPSTLEAISLPIYEAKSWLEGGATGDVADVDSDQGGDFAGGPTGRRALRLRSNEVCDPVTPADIRPGDTVVVPAAYGGCDEWGWSPTSQAPVTDLGTEANQRHRGLMILRFSRALVAQALRMEQAADVDARAGRFMALVDSLADATDRATKEALAASADMPDRWRDVIAGSGRILRNSGAALAFTKRVPRQEPTGAASTEDDVTSHGTKAVMLTDHSKGVRDYAARFAEQVRLPAAVTADVTLAAFLHDAGKAHPDFKKWLYGGDELASLAGPELAKSGRNLPYGGHPGRHEIASIAFALAHPAFAKAHDPELVLWLIGTHHGRGRPFFPPMQWPAVSETFSADVGDGRHTSIPALSLAVLTARWCDVQKAVTDRYGAWGLARLEAVLRLADHRRSEAEEGHA